MNINKELSNINTKIDIINKKTKNLKVISNNGFKAVNDKLKFVLFFVGGFLNFEYLYRINYLSLWN